MFQNRPSRRMRLAAPAALVAGSLLAGHAALAQQVGDVFYIEMENHNFTQPGTQSSPAAIFNNPAAPYQTSLITAGNPNAAQTSWASNYHNVATGVHPSEPNYIWQEAGSNLGVFNDNTPYGTGGTNQNTTQHLSGLLQSAGIGWKSYQEDIDTDAAGNVLPQSQWTVPLNNRSGTYNGVANAYNGSKQFNFAAKHDGQLFFTDTNGGNNTTTSNPEVSHYAPLQQLTLDLNSNNIAPYTLITPNQYNDSHSSLSTAFTYNGATYAAGTDAEAIAMGDNFLSIVVPQIQASQAYKNNGAIVIWWDETEGGDDSSRTLEEIVLSPLAKGNAYQGTLPYTHSSDLKTLQELFNVGAAGGGFLRDAANANDLSDLFKAGAIPQITPAPEPSQFVGLGVGVLGLAGLALKARRSLSAGAKRKAA